MALYLRTMVSVAALLAATSAWAGDQVILAPAAPWVRTAEVGAVRSAEAPEVGYRYRLVDDQTRFEAGVRHSYMRYRILLTSPDGLAEGGVIALDWSADHEDLTVHHVRVIRQGQVIEVLDSQAFEVLRRETGFESSMVMGLLTAALHPADLRVGDELDVAYTVSRKDPVVGAMPEGLVSAAFGSTVEHLKIRMSWPEDMKMQMRATEGWTVPQPRRRDGFNEVVVDMADVEPYFVPSDAPARFFRARQVELSSYQDWGHLVGLLAPSYNQAAVIGGESSIQAEIEKIRANHTTQRAQALAALRLVQDEVRYLAILLGEGGWLPTSADEVWRLRQGDCKGKTVLLMALLRGLGITADAALVSTTDGDSLADSLPRMHSFDHVIVRANLDGQDFWLDGTRAGDRVLEPSAQAPFKAALVLAEGKVGPEPMQALASITPNTEIIEILDASSGLFAPAKMTVKTIIRGAAGFQAAAAMQAMGPAARQRRFDQMREELAKGDLQEVTVNAAYDEELAAYVLTVSGRHDGLLQNGRISPNTTGFPSMTLSKRVSQEFETLPHVVNYPVSSLGRVDYRLPSTAQYDVYSGQMNFETVGVHFLREAKVQGSHVTADTRVAAVKYEITHEDFEKARLTPDPRLTQNALITVRGVYQLTEADRAAWVADEALTDEEKRAAAFERRVTDLMSLGLFDEAKTAADRAVETTGNQSAVWSARAMLRSATGDFEGAEADLDQAETLDPANDMVGYGRLNLANARGDVREAILAYTRLLRVTPTNVAVLQARAFAYHKSGLNDRALADMDAAIKAASDEEKSQAKSQKVFLLGLLGRTQEAEALSQEVLKESPGKVVILADRIDWLLDDNRGADAMALARSLAGREISEVNSGLMPMVEALAVGGDADGAVAMAQAHVATNPEHPFVLNEGCWALSRAGTGLDQAETWCNAAREAQPLSAPIADSRGRLYLQQGRYEEALAEFDFALSRASGMSAARYGRGLSLIALGREEEGRADLALAGRQNAESAKDFRTYTGAR